MGTEKFKLRSIIMEAKKAGRLPLKHTVPHMTLFGPFELGNVPLSRIKDCIEEAVTEYSFFEFHIDGYDTKQNAGGNGTVIAFKIHPSVSFRHFRKKITSKLLKLIPKTKEFDWNDDAWFHITIANHVSDRQFGRIWSHLTKDETGIIHSLSSLLTGKKINKKNIPYLPGIGTRITLLDNRGKIVFEYDLLQKRFLNRYQSLSSIEMRQTLRLLRLKSGNEVLDSKITRQGPYLISDTHFDHANIIRYCCRPFLSKDVNEMNMVLLHNWNNTVKDSDSVYFLGDLVYGKSSRPPSYWLRQLKGETVLIDGNHDAKLANTKPYDILEYHGRRFLLVHEPDKLPIKWDGWVIHGHKHNNDLRNYPFINGEKKTINVGVELIGYRPLSLDTLISLNIDTIRRMDTVSSQPVRIGN